MNSKASDFDFDFDFDTPPTSPSSWDDEVASNSLHACAVTALKLSSQESTVQHLYDAFGGRVDKTILDYVVTSAREAGPDPDSQAEALVQHASSNGVDQSFFTASRSPKAKTKAKVPHMLNLPVIENMELIGTLRRMISLPSNRVVDELCNHIGDGIDRENIAMVYGSIVEQSREEEEQALLLAAKIQDMGFAENFEVPEQDKFNCPVCMEMVSKQNGFEFQCGLDQEYEGSPHVLCFDCALNFVRAAVDRGDPEFHCYQCHHTVLPHELAQICGRGNEQAGRSHPLYRELDILKRDHAIGKDPAEYARCPSAHCDYVVARSERGAAEEANCPQCGFCFCTNCLAPYHYRTSCADRRRLHDAWRDWLVTGRVEYWHKDGKMRRKAEATARAEKKRVESVLRTEQLDEDWKAKNCRLCPHCNRLVNRLEGCSIMRCGYDTDTRLNVQQGCMQRFDWNTAEPYQAQAIGSHVKVQASSDTDNKARHEYWQCAVCDQVIVGLRFECVNCISFDLCENCEQDHWDTHAQGHLFRIHERADA